MDIRNTPRLSTFSGPLENPLSEGGKWAQVDSSDYPRQLQVDPGGSLLGVARGDASQPAGRDVYSSRWTPATYSGDVQVWAAAVDGADPGDAWSLRLFANVGGSGGVLDGYILNMQPGSPASAYFLYRMDNGSATLIDTVSDAGIVNIPSLVLLQTLGNRVQTYHSIDGGDNWDLHNDVIDNTYRTDLSLVLVTIASPSNFPAWDYFGGGVPLGFVPHVYRRQFGVA